MNNERKEHGERELHAYQLTTEKNIVTEVEYKATAKELKEDKPLSKNRLRKSGGGRKALREINNQLIEKIENLVDSTSRGDPENPLRWTSKSTRNISEELKEMGISASHALVARELSNMNYSLQANKKNQP